MSDGYRTRQRAVVLALLKEHHGQHLTAEEIVALLDARGSAVGKATVYRCLERLIVQGNVKKYCYGEGKSACYEYQPEEGHVHYHLKCAHCGALSDLECAYLDRLPEHVYAHHGFTLDAAAIVLMGSCAECSAHTSDKAQPQNTGGHDPENERGNSLCR